MNLFEALSLFLQSGEFPFRDYMGVLIMYHEKIKWAIWQMTCRPLSLSHQCDQWQLWMGGWTRAAL